MPPSPASPVHLAFCVTNVSDGDSFTAIVSGRRVKCRLYGIDAPELHQPFGPTAAENLRDLILDRVLEGRIITLDCYSRTVVDLWAYGAVRVALLMLRDGLAWHTPRWSPDRKGFSHAQHAARISRKGLWVDPCPAPPWTWRRQQGYRVMHARTSRRARVRRP